MRAVAKSRTYSTTRMFPTGSESGDLRPRHRPAACSSSWAIRSCRRQAWSAGRPRPRRGSRRPSRPALRPDSAECRRTLERDGEVTVECTGQDGIAESSATSRGQAVRRHPPRPSTPRRPAGRRRTGARLDPVAMHPGAQEVERPERAGQGAGPRHLPGRRCRRFRRRRRGRPDAGASDRLPAPPARSTLSAAVACAIIARSAGSGSPGRSVQSARRTAGPDGPATRSLLHCRRNLDLPAKVRAPFTLTGVMRTSWMSFLGVPDGRHGDPHSLPRAMDASGDGGW